MKNSLVRNEKKISAGLELWLRGKCLPQMRGILGPIPRSCGVGAGFRGEGGVGGSVISEDSLSICRGLLERAHPFTADLGRQMVNQSRRNQWA